MKPMTVWIVLVESTVMSGWEIDKVFMNQPAMEKYLDSMPEEIRVYYRFEQHLAKNSID